MDQRFRDILNEHPPRRSRSRLEPYAELILELRNRGRSFREIAELLGEKFDVAVTAAGVHHFVRRRRDSLQPSQGKPRVVTNGKEFIFEEWRPLNLLK